VLVVETIGASFVIRPKVMAVAHCRDVDSGAMETEVSTSNQQFGILRAICLRVLVASGAQKATNRDNERKSNFAAQKTSGGIALLLCMQCMIIKHGLTFENIYVIWSGGNCASSLHFVWNA
jgi:hypothetical protein